MSWLQPAITASLLGNLILTVVVGYLYQIYRERFLRTWAAAWGLYTLRLVSMLLLQTFSSAPWQTVLSTTNQLCALWSGALLLAGVYQFAEKPPPRPPLAAAFLLSAWVPFANVTDFSFTAATLPVYFFLGYVYITAGIVFLRQDRLPWRGRALTGWAFIFWGIHKADYPFLRPVLWFAPWGYLLGAVLEIIVALGTLLTYFEKARRELAVKEERLQLAVNGADLGLWDWDVDSGTFYFNDRWYTMLGYDPGELPPTYETWKNLLHPDDRQKAEQLITTGTASSGSWSNIFRLRARNGDYRWILIKGKVVERDAAGLPLRAAGTNLDVTPYKKLENALRRSELVHRSLTANLPDIVYRIYCQEDGRLHFFNEAAATITGYSLEELKAERFCPIKNLIVAEDRAQVVGTLMEAIEHGKPFAIQYRLRDKNGSIHWVQDKGRPVFDESGKVLFIDGLIHDLTELKEAEKERENLQRQLRQAQKMEAIGTLAGGIAHDFNNILSAVIGFTELSLYEKDVPALIRANLEEVMQAANRARTLVKQILTFSRQQEHERSPLHPAPILKEVIKMLRATVPSSIVIQADIDEDCSAVLAEPTQMHQLLMNLATNAVQAMEEKGELFFALCDREIRPADFPNRPDIAPGRYVCLQVRDTGCGMDQETLDRIFDPFFTTKEPGQGTGMGLAVVYGIVQRHGGHVIVESEPGRGSEFTVLLPPTAATQHPAAAVLTADMRLPGGHEHIVVVDDEEAIVNYEKRFLSWLGYRVTAFRDSEEALHFLEKHHADIDLLLTDQTMPKVTGLELGAAVHRLRPGPAIILCTGFSASVTEKTAREAGIDIVLSKPTRREEMARTIRRLLDGAGRTENSADG